MSKRHSVKVFFSAEHYAIVEKAAKIAASTMPVTAYVAMTALDAAREALQETQAASNELPEPSEDTSSA